jgi:hypothetical protein
MSTSFRARVRQIVDRAEGRVPSQLAFAARLARLARSRYRFVRLSRRPGSSEPGSRALVRRPR